MQESKAQRGSRGHYARLICQQCRSRKIKCDLPDGEENLEPSGMPQSVERSCRRCQNLGLDCIVDRTSLGRPAAKRARRKGSQPPASSAAIRSRTRDEQDIATGRTLRIDGYIFSDVAEDADGVKSLAQPSKEDLFRSMIDPASLFSSILANDRNFGASIIHTTSRCNEPLSDVIDDDTAASLDKR